MNILQGKYNEINSNYRIQSVKRNRSMKKIFIKE